MKKKISGKRNRIKWLGRGILYVSIVPWKILVAALVITNFLIWITILTILLITLTIIWIGLAPIELVVFLLTGLTGFILWPKIIISWWFDFPSIVTDLDSTVENLFCFVERKLHKEG